MPHGWVILDFVPGVFYLCLRYHCNEIFAAEIRDRFFVNQFYNGDLTEVDEDDLNFSKSDYQNI